LELPGLEPDEEGQPVDASGWQKQFASTGSKEGSWLIAPDGHLGLVKIPRRYDTNVVKGETWSELVAYKLGRWLEIKVPTISVVRYEGNICPVSWNFAKPPWELREGAALTNTVASNESKGRRLTMGQVRSALAELLYERAAERHLAEMVAFDLLLSNGDRHQRNWGVLWSHQGLPAEAAPIYDNGSALASSNAPDKITRMLANPQQLTGFLDRFQYEVAIDGSPPDRTHKGHPRARLGEVLELLRSWREILGGLRERLEFLTMTEIDQASSHPGRLRAREKGIYQGDGGQAQGSDSGGSPMTVRLYPGEILLVWKHPQTRLRFLIARVWKSADGYHFSYVRDMPRSLNQALVEGFRPLEGYPVDGPLEGWVSEDLPAFISSRLPAPRRREKEYAALGVSKGDDLEFLRVTGGRVPTDSFEFLQPIDACGDQVAQDISLRFPVAGWRYYAGESILAELTPGTPLQLKLAPHNEHDPNAIEIWSNSGHKLGFVPAIYAWYVDDAVSRGMAEAMVATVGPEGDPQNRLIVELRGTLCGPVRVVPERLQEYADLVTR